MKCPIPLRDPDLLRFVEENHEHFRKAKASGSFSIEFHYDREGELSTVHRGPVIKTAWAGPDREVLTLE